MFLKRRIESDELLTMRSLNARMELSATEKFHYSNLEKGYEGEVKFDRLAEGLREERFIISDLLLEVNNSYFQIDSLMISQGGIHLLDIKNFQGDFFLESDKLYAMSNNREYKNPFDQLKRSETLFRQLLQRHKQNFLIEASVLFINPEFTFYQVPLNKPIIFPTQVNQFFNTLNNTPSKLNDGHKKLAQTLLSLHKTKNPFTTLPEFSYEQLQKGIYCESCGSFHVAIKNSNFVCGKCGGHEKIEHAILRNVAELKLLFPERKITTPSVYEWCKTDLNRKTICRTLKKNYRLIGNTRYTYYE